MGSYTDYPNKAVENAKKAIQINEEYGGQCGTRVGKIRAKQLANRRPLSLETIKRTYAYLSRAKVYNTDSYLEDGIIVCGTVSYNLWGGHEMLEYTKNILKDIKAMNTKKDTRSIQGSLKVETRQLNKEGEDTKNEVVITGYAALFDSESNDLGGFTEVIDRKAFDKTDFSKVRALFNHDSNYVLGSVKAQTVHLEVDEKGLRYEVLVDQDNQTLQDLVIKPLQRGDIDQSSFAFTLREGKKSQKWDYRGKTAKRTILDIDKLYDVSIVTYPAYENATSSIRSLEQFLENTPNELEIIDDESQEHIERLLQFNLSSNI